MLKFGKILLVLLVFVPTLAMAHGPVTTQSQVIGDYDVEFEYNTLGSIFAGDYILYDVYLLKPVSLDPIDFTTVYIKFLKPDGSSLFAGSLAESSLTQGYANWGEVLSSPDTYTADISFFQGAKALVHTTFNFKVAAAQNSAQTNASSKPNLILLWISLIIAGVVIIGAGSYLLWRKHE